MKSYWQSAISTLVIGTLAITLNPAAKAIIGGTSSNTFNFTANFVGGGCEISAPANLEFNNGNALLESEIEQQAPNTVQTFDITLSGCNGIASTPSINVSGSKTSDFGITLFRDMMSATDANGYGILLETPGNNNFSSNANLALNSVISTTNWDVNTSLSTLDTTLPMVASLRCGECNYSGRQGGEFKSTVTFDFVYE